MQQGVVGGNGTRRGAGRGCSGDVTKAGIRIGTRSVSECPKLGKLVRLFVSVVGKLTGQVYWRPNGVMLNEVGERGETRSRVGELRKVTALRGVGPSWSPIAIEGTDRWATPQRRFRDHRSSDSTAGRHAAACVRYLAH